MTYDYAIHSDFLIYWTGKDIDQKLDPDWSLGDKSKTGTIVQNAYIARLRNILKFGLWMTDEEAWNPVPEITVPSTPACCFTELKVSESRRHARHYGRLGIGVKRPFLLNHFGRPLCYFGFGRVHNDRFLKACAGELRDKSLMHFFKPMNSSRTLNYDIYAESEWRILFFAELLEKRLIIDPRDPRNAPEHEYFQSLTVDEQAQLRYLVPLDGWFQFLIYPSLTMKNTAQQDAATGISGEIRRIKSTLDHGNRVEGGNWPIETDLDACRNF